MYFFVNALLCFFIHSVKSGFLAALRLGKPSLFAGDAVWCRLQHFPAVLDANFLAPGLSVVDFFAPPFLFKCPSRLMFSFFVHLQVCAWGLYWEEALWLRLEASLLLTYSLTTSTYFFYGNFLLSPGKNSSLFLTASILSRHSKNLNI